MKPFVFICSFMVFMVSCHSSDLETTSLPTGKVKITEAGETLMVDFTRMSTCLVVHHSSEESDHELVEYQLPSWDNLKSLISRYETLNSYPPNYMDYVQYAETILSHHEYALAQECFSNNCGSEVRKEILQLVIEKQKRKIDKDRLGLA